MKTGLVLEGGGMRGIYTAGVLDSFMEMGVTVDGVIGVSAGVVHGVSYLSGQKGRSIRYMKKYCKDWEFMSMKSLLKTGDLVGKEFSYHKIPYELDPFDFDTFLASKTEFIVTATNVETGKAEYMDGKKKETCIDVIRASASMPIVSTIVEIEGKKYLDGGTGDSIPIRKMQELGYEKNIVILTQPEGYRKKPEKMLPLMKHQYRHYPEYIEACRTRHERYNESLAYLEELKREGKILLIRPSQKIKISKIEKNPDVIQAQYDLGRQDAEARRKEILEILADSAGIRRLISNR